MNLNNSIGLDNPVMSKIFNEMSVKIERMSRFFNSVLTRLTTAGIMLPSLIITLVDYFIYDLGKESYYLSWPILYVYQKIIYLQIEMKSQTIVYDSALLGYHFSVGKHHWDILFMCFWNLYQLLQ